MLYHHINELEKRWPGFNKRPFNASELVDLAEDMGIRVVKSDLVECAGICYNDGRYLLMENPHMPELERTLALGHELGHFALGHVNEAQDLSYHSSCFATTGIEKDAGIIGSLLWYPTPLLEQYPDAHTIPERLFEYVKHFNDEILEEDLFRICWARYRIFSGFHRVKEKEQDTA